MKNILVIDTETTGLDHEKEKVVEIAAVVVDAENYLISKYHSELIDPGIPIPVESTAIHHLKDEDVKGKRNLDQSVAYSIGPLVSGKGFVPAAHYAAFDSLFVKIPGDWICTNRCAKHLWPNAPGHSNQVLRYWIKDLDYYANMTGMAMPPHRALPDAWVTAHLVIRMLQEGNTVEDLLRLTKTPILLKTCRFGKHANTDWKDVPRDYLIWILKGDHSKWDPDIIHTAKYYAGGG